MPQLSACPDVSAYRELMRGRTPPEIDSLLEHLRECPQCRRMVQALEDWLVNASAVGAPDSEGRRRARRIAAGGSKAGAGTDGAGGDDSLAVLPAGFLSPPEAPGEMGRLGGYRVLGVLGKGGMGVVFRAEDADLRRRVALKVMRPDVALNAQHRERFLREARAVASVESDHVCPVYQVGEASGVPFIAMPLLRGESLESRLRREGALPVGEAVRLGREMALGLAAAHEGGLIHRDVKPANVWLEEAASGAARVRLLDFGLARGESDGRLTRTGEVMGTPAYMSPEQARGHKVDARTDLFSLGVILYEMLAGARPFTGSDPVSVLASMALDTPQAPASRRPGVSAGLSDLVMALLEKAADRRPAGAREVAARLERLQPVPAVAAPAAPSGNYVLSMESEARPAASSAWSRTGLGWAAVLALAFVVGGGLTAYVLARGMNGPAPQLPPQDALASKGAGLVTDAAEGEKEKHDQADKARRAEEEARKEKEVRDSKEKEVQDSKEQAEQARKEQEAKRKRDEEEAAYRTARLKAAAAMAANRYDEARQAYAQALRHRPADPEALDGDREAVRLQSEQQEAMRAEERRRQQEEARDRAYQLAMRDARKACDDREWADAIRAYDRALAQKASDPAALGGRRVAREEQDRAELEKKKEAAYRAAMQKAAAAMKARKYVEARDAYAEALVHRPKDADALRGDGDASRLLAAQQEARRKEAAYQAAMQKAATAMKAKKYEEARDQYAEALKQKPKDAEAAGGRDQARLLFDKQQEEARLAEAKRKREEEEKRRKEAEALFREGMDAYFGLGKEIDEEKGLKLLRRAADKGHGVAGGWAACLGCGAEKDEKAAWKLVANSVPAVREKAEEGVADAQALLGILLLQGLGVARNEKKALEWLEKAGEQGDAVAACYLGWVYSTGRGVDKDRDRAVRWYRKSADKGHPEAMNWMGCAYSNGWGVKKDNEKAAEWLREAADKGYVRAASNLGLMYRNGWGVVKDEKKAVAWFAKAAGKGDSRAAYYLGEAYDLGRGVVQDASKAAEWYEKAGKKGHASAMTALGSMYAGGRGVSRDDRKAVKWFQGAVDKGDGEAMSHLGDMYASGRGVDRDFNKANEYYKKAAAHGYERPVRTVSERVAQTREIEVPVTSYQSRTGMRTVSEQVPVTVGGKTTYQTVTKQVPYTYTEQVPKR
jgi:TPR repeat protein